MFEYICPDCDTKLKASVQAEPGQEFKCPRCLTVFIPRAEVIKFADGDAPAKKKVKPKAAPAPAAAPPPPPPPPRPMTDDDEDDTPYAVAKESEEEQLLAEKNKPTFGAIRDKFKRSARGPAAAILVLPSNLLIGQGALTAVVGLGMVINGSWPLIFTDVSPSDEEIVENAFYICLGLFSMVWGGITCFGASHMSSLDSYPWAFVGACFGLLPLLAGVFSIIALKDPRVVAGFHEPLDGPNHEEIDGKSKSADEDDEEEEEDDEEEEEERPAKRRKR